LGVQTEVLIPIPKKRFDRLAKNNCEGYHNGGYFKYMTGSSVRSRYYLKRKIDDIWGYWLTLWFIIKKIRSDDKIIVYRGEWFWYVLVSILAILKKIKIYLELNELPYITHKVFFENLKRYLTFKLAFPCFDGFISISNSLFEVANKYKSFKAKVIKIPIIVIPEDFYTKRKELGFPYIFHAGTLYEQKDGIIGMLKAFSIASKSLPKLKFVLTGNYKNSPDRDEIELVIKKEMIGDKVIFTGYLSIQELNEYMNGAILAIINKSNTKQNHYCFSTKLGEYLACGVPVIMTAVGEANYYLKNNVSAYIVEPNNPEQIAKKILLAFSAPEERKQIAEQGKKLINEDFNYIIQSKRILDFII